MKPAGPLKHFAIPFAIALALYVVAYTWIENRRTRHGPWVVGFVSESGGAPTLVINEPKLAVANARITFPGETAPGTNVTLDYSVPKEGPFPAPFGQCLFMDTTFQPGTVVFDLFGHEVQLMPRVLTVDKQEHAWKSDSVLVVTNAGVRTNAAR